MLYYIDPRHKSIQEIKEIVLNNKQIKFISLLAVDLGNHHTDEKIPVETVLEDFETFLKNGIQTDGSSVVLPGIADINNAKVDIIPDTNVKWFVDYNPGLKDFAGNRVGTLNIPSFLLHDGKFVCSRSILKRATESLDKRLKALINNSPELMRMLDLEKPVSKVDFTLATELELWVKSPDLRADEEKLSTSQTLKEQYWKRTVGNVRAALEDSLIQLQNYGLTPEMAHKEVGGVPSRLKGSNYFTHVMEQIEIDWKYDLAIQSADHEMIVRDIIFDVFSNYGLDVTFKAKPIEGVAGSGEHHHLGILITTEDGKKRNLFAPADPSKDYLTRFGYGALMGILKNYALINPFVTSTNDAFNRLKPGFEAPVCVVTSLGHKVDQPSRNRTVLIGLVRDQDNPFATRFELRSPNPYTNTYLAVSSIIQCMMDGMTYAVEKEEGVLLDELNKKTGDEAAYLFKNREYRSESDVFEEYTSDERDKLFGPPPKTVYENILQFRDYDRNDILLEDGIFTQPLIESYFLAIEKLWLTELQERIVPYDIEIIRDMKVLHENDAFHELDSIKWEEIHQKRISLMKDTLSKESLFTQLTNAIHRNDLSIASQIQISINAKMTELKKEYRAYKKNIITL